MITDNANQPYIYVLFFTKYPPGALPERTGEAITTAIRPVQSFDRYRFEDPQAAYLKLLHGVFVFTGWEPAPAKPVYTIRSPNGPVAYQVVEK